MSKGGYELFASSQIRIRLFDDVEIKMVLWQLYVRLSVCAPVCLSVRMEQLGSHWKDFDKTWHFTPFFRKYVEKIQVSLKSDKNNGYFTRRRFHIYDNISLNAS
jgi:hypothetical protein